MEGRFISFVTPRMSLKVWNSSSDPYDHEQLADNFLRLDQHDHTPGRGAQITGASIAEGSITSAHIFPGAITVDLVAPGSVVGTSLADGSVSTPKIVDGAVTSAKLANDAVTSAKILDGTITNGDLAGGIASAKLAGGITKTQLDTTALNAFVKLAASGDVLLKFGVGATGSFSGGHRLGPTAITHGLGRTPIAVVGACGWLQTFGDAGTVPVIFSSGTFSSTTFFATFQTSNGDNTSQSCPFYWVAIG